MTQLTTTPSGVELIRTIFRGDAPPPPMAELIGMHGVSADEGRVVFALDPGERHYNPMGTVHGGVAATLLDSAMTCAVHTALPAGSVPTTVELSVRFVRPITVATGRITAEGVVLHVGRRTAVAEGRLTGPDGALLATAATTCAVLEVAS